MPVDENVDKNTWMLLPRTGRIILCCFVLKSLTHTLILDSIYEVLQSHQMITTTHICCRGDESWSFYLSFKDTINEGNGMQVIRSYKYFIPIFNDGMGIDCPDIHQIIHFGPPSNIESYTQETGQAGHDDLLSKVILFDHIG